MILDDVVRNLRQHLNIGSEAPLPSEAEARSLLVRIPQQQLLSIGALLKVDLPPGGWTFAIRANKVVAPLSRALEALRQEVRDGYDDDPSSAISIESSRVSTEQSSPTALIGPATATASENGLRVGAKPSAPLSSQRASSRSAKGAPPPGVSGVSTKPSLSQGSAPSATPRVPGGDSDSDARHTCPADAVPTGADDSPGDVAHSRSPQLGPPRPAPPKPGIEPTAVPRVLSDSTTCPSKDGRHVVAPSASACSVLPQVEPATGGKVSSPDPIAPKGFVYPEDGSQRIVTATHGGARIQAYLGCANNVHPPVTSVSVLSRLGELPPPSLWPLSRDSLHCVELAARDLVAILPTEVHIVWYSDVQRLTHRDESGEPEPIVTLAKVIRAASERQNLNYTRKPRYDIASDLLRAIYRSIRRTKCLSSWTIVTFSGS